jgi:hypothetical protein
MSRNLTTETCAPPTGLKTAEIISIFLETGREKIFSRDLASILRYGRDGLRSLALKDSAFDEYAISKLLRPYGVKPATIRIGTEVNKGGSSTFVMGKGEAVGSQKADRGLAVGCRLSPHPGLLPRGEGVLRPAWNLKAALTHPVAGFLAKRETCLPLPEGGPG